MSIIAVNPGHSSPEADIMPLRNQSGALQAAACDKLRRRPWPRTATARSTLLTCVARIFISTDAIEYRKAVVTVTVCVYNATESRPVAVRLSVFQSFDPRRCVPTYLTSTPTENRPPGSWIFPGSLSAADAVIVSILGILAVGLIILIRFAFSDMPYAAASSDTGADHALLAVSLIVS